MVSTWAAEFETPISCGKERVGAKYSLGVFSWTILESNVTLFLEMIAILLESQNLNKRAIVTRL